MKLSAREKRLVIFFGAVLGLIGVYMLLSTIVPGMAIWSIPKTINESSSYINIDSQNVYEQEFEMPFSKLCSVQVPFFNGEAGYVVAFDIKMELLDDAGAVVAEKTFTTVFDSSCGFKYLNVNKGGKYTLRLTVNSIGNGTNTDAVPKISVSDDGKVVFKLRGLSGDSNDKSVFAIMFVLSAAVFLAFLTSVDKDKIGSCKIVDSAVVGLLIIVGMLFVCQFSDLFDISRTSLKMLDSFKHGNIFGYNDYMYYDALKNQSPSQAFACDYNFISIFICGIFLIPVYLIYGSDVSFNRGGYAAVFTLLLVILASLLLSYYLLKRIVKECDMGDSYLRNVRALFISSSMIIYMSVVFGQIDILYLLVIIFALPFYYRKKYLLFSLIMSVAISMKTLPFLVFVPLVLLANKKVKDILMNLAIGMIFPVLTKILFERNVGHGMLADANAIQYGFVERVNTSMIGGQISLFILSFVLVCIFAYMAKTDTDNKKKMLYNSMLAIFVVYSSFAVFVDWHQQWLTPLVLSFAFLLPYHEESKKLLLIDVFAEALFILFANTGGVSIYMVNFGIFPKLTGQYYSGTSVKFLLDNISPIAVPAVKTMLAGILIYMVWHFTRNRSNCQKTFECSRAWVIGRAGVLYAFILFYCWCFSYIG